MIMRSRTHLCWLGFLVLLGLAGCTYKETVINDGWGTIRRMAGQRDLAHPKDESEADEKPERAHLSDQGWAILLDSADGENRYRRTKPVVDRLTNEFKIKDMWTKEVNGVVLVLRGRYPDPSTDEARRDLREIRTLMVDGVRPYEQVQFVPLTIGAGGGSPVAGGEAPSNPLDMRTHRGKSTLLIGFYDAEYGPDFRKAAERAAATMRDNGDEAFFYHGPRFSILSVGIFGEEDTADGGYGPRILEVKKKYPYYTGNGRTLIETVNGRRLGEKSSVLMKIDFK